MVYLELGTLACAKTCKQCDQYRYESRFRPPPIKPESSLAELLLNDSFSPPASSNRKLRPVVHLSEALNISSSKKNGRWSTEVCISRGRGINVGESLFRSQLAGDHPRRAGAGENVFEPASQREASAQSSEVAAGSGSACGRTEARPQRSSRHWPEHEENKKAGKDAVTAVAAPDQQSAAEGPGRGGLDCGRRRGERVPTEDTEPQRPHELIG